MQHCIELALKGLGSVAPNPMVGCVLVYNDQIIAEGYHQKFGDAHAEVNAINQIKDNELLKRCTLYVTLEPCAHHGKTPPCTDLIIEKKIPSVVIGCVDTYKEVSGKGIEKLKAAGIEVTVGVLEKECRELNKRFFTFHEKQRPYVILKWAQSSDGFIDAKRNIDEIAKQKKISNQYSQKLSHRWRTEEQAIMVGTNTALMDNPSLTARLHPGKNPLRIFIDKWLRIPKAYNLYDRSTPTLVITGSKKENEKNIEYLNLNFEANLLEQLLHELFKRNIQSLIVEGGESLLNSFIEANLWDEARVFISPQLLKEGVKAPVMLHKVQSLQNIQGDELLIYRNN